MTSETATASHHTEISRKISRNQVEARQRPFSRESQEISDDRQKDLEFVSSIFDPLGITMPLTLSFGKHFNLLGPRNFSEEKNPKPGNSDGSQRMNWRTQTFERDLAAKELLQNGKKFSRHATLCVQRRFEACPCIRCLLKYHPCRNNSGKKIHHQKSTSSPLKRITILNLELEEATNGA